MKNKQLFHALVIAAAFLITCAAIASGSYFRAGIVIAVGYPSGELIRADRTVDNVLATERNRQEAWARAERLELNYAPDPDVWLDVQLRLSLQFEAVLTEIREGYLQELRDLNDALEIWEEHVAIHEAAAEQARLQWEAQHTQAILDGAPLADLPIAPEIPLPPSPPEWQGRIFERFAPPNLPIILSESAQVHIVEMHEEDFSAMWEAIYFVSEFVQVNTVIQEVDFGTERTVQARLRDMPGMERATEDIAEQIIMNSLRANAIADEAMNQFDFDRVANNYERIIVWSGQIIVDAGDIITEEIYHVLAQLGLLRPDSLMENIFPLFGVFAVVAALFLAVIMYLYFYRPSIGKNIKEAMLLLTLYVLTLSLVWAFSEFGIPYLPLLIFSMLVSVLIERRTAVMLTFAMVFISYFVVEGSLTFLLFYSISGLLICLLSRFTTERSKMLLVGIMITTIQFALSVAITVIVEGNQAIEIENLSNLFATATLAALSGFLTVIICTGSLPLWETFFGVVTPVKLLDLTNPTNLLLRRLTIEAPGTYHHSLIVANLAETAAYDIGANAHAARVGGYYHDVGKLKYPHYFAENLDGDNPHDHLDPITSAQLITSHVSHGLTLASEHRLPQFVRDIIKEHHGTTILQFFYSKAKKLNENVDDKDYRYPYTIPQSRESACVMLADSVEAAARAVIPKLKSVDEVEITIGNIIRGKLNDGQLAESDLSIKDVTTIEQSFFRVLKGMYHERIAYPKVSLSPEERETEQILVRR